MSQDHDIGVIGLAVMGQNLILNLADHGFRVVAYNRTTAKVDEFLSGAAKGFSIVGAHSPKELCDQLASPRKVLLMVKAGSAVDDSIAALLPYLQAGDIIVDGGNSQFEDSARREKQLAQNGIHFVGAGISGGEEGARNGPSIMPGGASKAWASLAPILQAISAHTDAGEPCCDWVGPEGSGHFLKMVHNGIEYGDMQLIAESYHLLSSIGKSPEQQSKIFAKWNQGDLGSYLVEITSAILAVKDGRKALVERILDSAGQKGTGRWTSESALKLGVPLTLITESVYARALSALVEERAIAAKKLPGPHNAAPSVSIEAIRQALLASKLVSYAQGFMLLGAASKEYGWKLDLGACAMLWRGGCIIRSGFLEKIRDAYRKDSDLSCLLLDPWFRKRLEECQPGWRRTVAAAAKSGLPLPGISAALAFYDGFRSARLPANLIQAQRDYFGAHTFERVDEPRGKFFHHDWIGSGGFARSGTYSA